MEAVGILFRIGARTNLWNVFARHFKKTLWILQSNFITPVTNKPLHHLRWKQTLRPQATLQQLLLPGLITEQTLLQGSSDNKLISQMTEYALH